jgi:transcription elongation GreA/GreB family factor
LDLLREAREKLEEEAAIETELRVKLLKGDPGRDGPRRPLRERRVPCRHERQSTLQARMGQIQKRLADLSRIDVSSISRSGGLGSEVTVENLDTGEAIRYTLVIPEIADGKKNFVSIAAPIGRALLNRKVGDTVTVTIPKGTCELEVRKIVTLFGDVFG